MLELILLTAGFAIGNFLDGLTTWAAIFKLPEGSRSKELNPVLSSSIYTRFKGTMLLKGLGTAMILGYYWSPWYPIHRIFNLRVLDMLMLLVVFNNSYVYFFKTAKRGWLTPGKVFTKVLHLSDAVAFFCVVTCMSVASTLIVWLIQGRVLS